MTRIESTVLEGPDYETQLAEWFDELWQDFEDIELTPPLEQIMGGLEDLHHSYFNTESGPDGEGWAVLSPETIARKGHDTILVDTERLARSLIEDGPDAIREISEDATTAELIYGTAVPYSVYHNADTGREHIGVNDQHLDDMTDVVVDAALEQWP